MLCGIRARLSASYSPSKGMIPSDDGAVRHFRIATETRTRLDVKHAASVRSEPGIKLSFESLSLGEKKMPSDEHRRASLQAKLFRSITQPPALEKADGTNGSGTSYRLSKSDKPPCPAGKAMRNKLKEYTVAPTGCQPGDFRFSTVVFRYRGTPSPLFDCPGRFMRFRNLSSQFQISAGEKL